MLSKGEPPLASIATCLLLQAAILGAGWLLQNQGSEPTPLPGHRSGESQPSPGAGPDAALRPPAPAALAPIQPWRLI